MRVLMIIAVATLTAAAPQLRKEAPDNAAEVISGFISEDGLIMETNKALEAQRFLRSTDESESTTDDVYEGVSEANDLSKEIAEEMMWAAEEKKWQEQAKADTESAKLDGEAASTNTEASEPQDSEEKKWDEQENQGTEATELEYEASDEQDDSYDSDSEESSETLIPAVPVEGVDSEDVETFIPQLSLVPNVDLPWVYPSAYYRTWIYQFPQYYQAPHNIQVSTY